MFEHLLESSKWDDYNKWSNLEFGEGIGITELKRPFLSGALKKDWTIEYKTLQGAATVNIADLDQSLPLEPSRF